MDILIRYLNLEIAVAAGLVEESTVTAAARRTIVPLFSAGLYDPLDQVEWSTLGEEVIGSDLHLQIRDEAALQVGPVAENVYETWFGLTPGCSFYTELCPSQE